MSGFTTRDVVVDGIRVQVMEAGRGEPLVYFHGAGTMTGFDDLELAQLLRPGISHSLGVRNTTGDCDSRRH